MHSFTVSLLWKFRRLQLPTLALIALLQRTPVLRVLFCAESVVVRGSLGQVLRSTALVATAVGAVDTLAGATTFSATPASPAAATSGTAFQAAFAVTGAPSAVKAYTIAGLPPGLTVTGATASGADLLLNASTGTITGTPTTAGNFTTVITAWEKVGGTGNKKAYNYLINVTGGAVVTTPSITTQPNSQSVTAGGTASFSVMATSTAPLSYQWQKDGAAVAGATSATYSIASAATSDAGTYTVVVSSSAGSATSNGATLTVNAAASAPSITTQPSSQSVTTGGAVSFSVAATGTAPLSYQWRKDGAALSGATSATYSIASAAAGDAGTYSVVVTNSAGTATSNGATLTVSASNTATAPSITSQPTNVTVSAGQSATFSAAASGTAPLSFQWRKDGAAIAGATSTSYTIGTAARSDAASYTVVVTNSAGSATSNAATLTLTLAASIFPHLTALTFDGSGRLYAADSTNNTVQRIAADGTVTLVAGSTGNAGSTNGSGTAALFNQPGGAVAANDGTLYVADTANALIRRIATDGTVTTLAGNAALRGNVNGTGATATFSAPTGLALDASGNLYVADATNHTIRKITSAGAVTTSAGQAGSAGSANGSATSARFNNPTAVAVDSAGNVYVADTNNNTVRKISAAGAVTTLAGVSGVSGATDGTGSAALFNQPQGLALDSAGNLYVADTGNSSVRKITTAGTVTTVAGLSTISSESDGDDDTGSDGDHDRRSTASSSLFNHPLALAVSPSGALYVGDTGAAAVRTVASDGTVTTLTLTLAPVGSGGSNSGGSSTNGTGSGSSSNGGTSGSGASGGGGAPSLWLPLAASLALAARRWRRVVSR